MVKRSSFDIKKRILELIKSSNLTFAQLERKTNTGYNTVKNNCEELAIYGFIKIEKKEKHPKSGRNYFEISITLEGRDFLNKKIKENKNFHSLS